MARASKYNISDLTAKDVMDKKSISISKREPLSDILGKMRKNNLFELPVIDDKKLVGMVSYSKLVKRRNIPLFTHAEHVMYQPAEAEEQTTLMDVAELLVSNHNQAIPITKKGRFLGIVTREGICSILPEVKEFAEIPVTDVMTPDPQCVKEDESLAKARKMMKGLDERFIPVIDDRGRLTGIVGSREIVKFWKRTKKESRGEVAGEKKPVEIIVKSIMRNPITIPSSKRVGDAIDLMIKRDIPSVVVIKDGKPEGIVTMFDCIGLLTRSKEREGVYVEIIGLEEEEHDLNELMYEVIEKHMHKIGKIIKPTLLSIHIVPHHSYGGEVKYGLRAKMGTDRKMFYTSSYDWNLMRVLEEVMEQLERMVNKEKEIKLERRKKNQKARRRK